MVQEARINLNLGSSTINLPNGMMDWQTARVTNVCYVVMDSGLLRCGKSCRLRWVNYLRPGIKRGNFTADESDIIIRLHSIHGTRWSFIATELAGRTDNEVKNYWNSNLKRKLAIDSGNNDVDDSKKKKKKTTKKKTNQKSRKVKILEKVEETVPQHASSSWPLPSPSESLSLTLRENNSYYDGVMNSESPSSRDADLLSMDMDWRDWVPWMEMEGEARTDGDDDLDIRLADGFDTLMSKEEESNMLEKLYDEYLLLLENEDQV